MEVRIIHNPKTVYDFLADKSPYDYIYQLNNLSKNEWDKVTFYGLYNGTKLHSDTKLLSIAMLSINYSIPVLLAASFINKEYNIELIGRIKKFLPPKFYAHIDRETLESNFSKDQVSDLHEYMNMGLCDYRVFDNIQDKDTVRLGFLNVNEIKELLSISYPEAWLDDELLKLNNSFGIIDSNKLVSFAGIHAYSEEYQVAAVAHVTTHPDFRKRGYGEKAVYSLLKELKDKIKYIGLNVKVDNLPAINCYRKLGFCEFGKFVDCEISNNT